MGSAESNWATAKRQIANELKELTLLWYVGLAKRRAANAAGIYRWTDTACTAAALGITGPRLQPILQALLDINATNGPTVAPAKVTAAEEQSRETTTGVLRRFRNRQRS